MFDRFTVCISALSLLKIKETGTIAHFKNQDEDKIKKLMAMGLIPGKIVTLEETFPDLVIKIAETKIKIDRELGNLIYVKINESEN